MLPDLLFRETRKNAPRPEPEERERLLALLREGFGEAHWFTRGVAAEALARAGEAPEKLKDLLLDDEEEVRHFAASAMGFSGKASWTRFLAEALLDAGRDPEQRAAAAVGLGLVGAPSSYLGNGLDLGGHVGVRGAALAGLYLRADTPSKLLLGKVAARRDERVEIRALALGFLAKGGRGGGMDPGRFLVAVLSDLKSPVALRRAAVLGLRLYPERRAALLDAAEADPSPMVRGFAWVSLARMGADAKRLKDLLDRMRRTFDEKIPVEEKILLALAIGWSGDKMSAGPLIKAFTDAGKPEAVRAWCARGLGLLRHGGATASLVKAVGMEGPKNDLARASLEALALACPPEGIEALRVSLFTGSRHGRRTAALGLASTESGRSFLEKALTHEEAEGRRAAALALGAVRGLESLGAPVEPDRPTVRMSVYQALGDHLDARDVPLRFSLALDLDPASREKALLLPYE